MKNKSKLFSTLIIIILLTVFICGCGEEDKKVQNKTPIALTLISKDSVRVSDSDSGVVITPSESSAGTIADTPKVTETVTKNDYVITPVTEGLCEQLEVSELGKLAEYNAFNRLEANSETQLMLEHKVCIDDATGVVYYVNVGRDYFLYRIKDGKSELAVELPVNYLYTHKGVVYFLLDAQNIVEGVGKDSLPGRYMYDKFTFEGMKEGDIYSYTPATGKVELIYPAQALRLKVADDGIYYLKGQLDKTEKKATGLKWYYIPFGGTEPEQIESGGMDDVWNDYQYDRSENTLRLKSETTGDVIEIVPDNEYMHSCVYKDMIFSSKTKPATVLKCFDLLTQEEKYTYNLEESITSTDWAPKEGTGALRKFQSDGLLSLVEHGNIQSTRFAMTEDSMLWFLVQQYIYRINTETGETQLFYYPVKGNYADGSFATMSPLYTDGKNLYVIYYPDDKVAEPVFGRLVFGYEETSGIWHWDVTDKIGVND